MSAGRGLASLADRRMRELRALGYPIERPPMTGCAHNASRVLVYPDSSGAHTNAAGRSFDPEQAITLVCPHGCPDVIWALRGGRPETPPRPAAGRNDTIHPTDPIPTPQTGG